MDITELDIALEELENRLERLRALYEQYFMGIERIEPAIPRKDIDRRIYILRREKIRNTAKRFKLQTIISRYNTFQQYWQRICREIEQGTYKRHVIKAERIAPGKLLTIAARKRLGRAALDAMEEVPPGAAPYASPAAVPPGAAPYASPAAVPLAANAVATPATVSTETPASSVPPRLAPPPKPGARPAPAPAPEPRTTFESLDLDMDFLGDWDPNAATAARQGARRAPEIPARPFGTPLSRPLGSPPPPTRASNPQKTPERPLAGPSLGAAPPAAPRPPARAPAIPVRSAPTEAIPKAVSATESRAPVAPPPRPEITLPRPTSAAPAKPARPTPPPAAAKPLAAPFPGVTPPKLSGALPPKPSPPAPAPQVTSTDERVRELHARLVEAKRQTQDGAAVSMEGLARSMKATEAKLREIHKNRKIDFDVVIKDGRAVLKPIVR